MRIFILDYLTILSLYNDGARSVKLRSGNTQSTNMTDSKEQEKTQTRPKDRFQLVFIICCWLGIGMFLPWNVFYNVDGYWKKKFRNIQNETVQERINRTQQYRQQLQIDLVLRLYSYCLFYQSLRPEQQTEVLGLGPLHRVYGSKLHLPLHQCSRRSQTKASLSTYRDWCQTLLLFRITPRIYGSIICNIILFILTLSLSQVSRESSRSSREVLN